MFILKYIFFGRFGYLIDSPLILYIYSTTDSKKNALRNSVFGLLLSQTGMVMLYGMALMTVDEKLVMFFSCTFLILCRFYDVVAVYL